MPATVRPHHGNHRLQNGPFDLTKMDTFDSLKCKWCWVPRAIWTNRSASHKVQCRVPCVLHTCAITLGLNILYPIFLCPVGGTDKFEGVTFVANLWIQGREDSGRKEKKLSSHAASLSLLGLGLMWCVTLGVAKRRNFFPFLAGPQDDLYDIADDFRFQFVVTHQEIGWFHS